MPETRAAKPSRSAAQEGSPSPLGSRLIAAAVARAQRGDRDGLHFIYVRFAADVKEHVQSFLPDPDEAEDVAQGVFAKLQTAIGGYKSPEVPFEAWLLRVAHDEALDRLQSRAATAREEVRVHDE